MENKSSKSIDLKKGLLWIKDTFNPKDIFKDATRSVLFWNGALYVAFIVGLFIDREITLILVSGIGSLIVICCIIDNEFEKSPNIHYWPPLTGIFWLAILFMICLGICYG